MPPNTFQRRDGATAARPTHASAAQTPSLAVSCGVAVSQQHHTANPVGIISIPHRYHDSTRLQRLLSFNIIRLCHMLQGIKAYVNKRAVVSQAVWACPASRYITTRPGGFCGAAGIRQVADCPIALFYDVDGTGNTSVMCRPAFIGKGTRAQIFG